MLNAPNKMPIKEDITSGFYRGVVISNNDPLKLLRCQITVPQVYGGIEDEYLPWASQVRPAGLGTQGNQGAFATPNIGDEVLVVFEGNDPHCPMYLGSVVTATNYPELAESGYPQSYGYEDKNANWWRVNLAAALRELFFVGKSLNQIDGDVHLKINGKLVLDVTGGIHITSGDDTLFKGEGDFQIHAENIAALANDVLGLQGETALNLVSDSLNAESSGSGNVAIRSAGGEVKIESTTNNVRIQAKNNLYLYADTGDIHNDVSNPAVSDVSDVVTTDPDEVELPER